MLLFFPCVLFCSLLQASYCLYLDLYWEKNGFTDFQNFLLSEILVTLISLKHFSLVWGSNLTKKIPLLLTIVPVFIRTLLKLFLSLDLSIIAFLRDLVIKASFLKQRTFTLTGVISFTISRDTAWKVE